MKMALAIIGGRGRSSESHLSFFEMLRLAPKGRLMDVLVDYTIDTEFMTR